MSIAHRGQGVELGIGWGSVGQKRVDWSRSSPPRIVAQKRIDGKDDGACSRMARVRGAKAARRKVHGILLWSEVKPMEMTWAPQRRMVFSWPIGARETFSQGRNIFHLSSLIVLPRQQNIYMAR